MVDIGLHSADKYLEMPLSAPFLTFTGNWKMGARDEWQIPF